MNLKEELTTLLNKAAQKLNLTNYTINLHLDVQKGDGLMGEFYKVSITDDETSSTIHLVIKKAPDDKIRREDLAIDLAYENEILFYEEIYPTLRNFETEYCTDDLFDSVPEYITSTKESLRESIVLRDITKSGFILREKDLLFDDEHAKFIFRTYGHFHALSFCLKEKKPQEFQRLTKPLHCVWKTNIEKAFVFDSLVDSLQKAYESLDVISDKIIMKKFKKYVDNTREIWLESYAGAYKGQYFGILHGDCWSNNMMFKYENDENYTKLKKISLLDFQLCIVGSVVYDLSYFFYTGGSKELFDKLETYLDVYHETFSEYVKRFGCDPDVLLPREVLTQEWKDYARFGMILAIMLTRVKLITKEDTIKFVDSIDKESDQEEKNAFLKAPYNEAIFNKRVRDLLVHLNEIDAL